MSDALQRTEEELAELADARELEYFLPNPNEVFLDLDDENRQLEDAKVLEMLQENGYQVTAHLTTVSKHGNIHRYLRFNQDMSHFTRLIIQACLGSDPKKEILSMFRTEAIAVSLFETHKEAKRVRAWRKKAS